jgi:putative membrane protein
MKIERAALLGLVGVLSVAGSSRSAFAHAPGTSASSPLSVGASVVLTGTMVGVGLLYRAGVERMGVGGRNRLVRARELAFYGGLLSIIAALTAPLDAVASDRFSAHMVQHVLLVFVAAPLLVASRPRVALLGLPAALRRPLLRSRLTRPGRGAWRAIGRPLVAWPVFFAAIWLWHVPAFYDAAERNRPLHGLEHATLFLSGLAFFGPLASRTAGAWRVPYFLGSALHLTALGALMTFSTTPWYSHYSATAEAHGFDALRDQQIAGLVMSGGGTVALLTAAALSFLAAMRPVPNAPVGNLKRLEEGPR